MSLLKDPRFLQGLENILNDPEDTLHLLDDLAEDGLKFDRRYREFPHSERVKIVRELIAQFERHEMLH